MDVENSLRRSRFIIALTVEFDHLSEEVKYFIQTTGDPVAPNQRLIVMEMIL